jgi:hypothetical protein
MQVLRKWDFERGIYRPYTIPDAWHVAVFESDMNMPINCAQCGKSMPFGKGYTSKTIHTLSGLGYSVCSVCYIAEVAEGLKYE